MSYLTGLWPFAFPAPKEVYDSSKKQRVPSWTEPIPSGGSRRIIWGIFLGIIFHGVFFHPRKMVIIPEDLMELFVLRFASHVFFL